MDMKTMMLLLVLVLVLFRDQLFGDKPAAGTRYPYNPANDPGAVRPPVAPVHVQPTAPARPVNATDVVIYGINAAAGIVDKYVNPPAPAPSAPWNPGPTWGPTEDQLFGS